MSLGERLADARLRAGLMQTEVARHFKDFSFTNKKLSSWENNVCEPGCENILMLAKYYNVSLYFLFGVSEEPDSFFNRQTDLSIFDGLTDEQIQVYKDSIETTKKRNNQATTVLDREKNSFSVPFKK